MPRIIHRSSIFCLLFLLTACQSAVAEVVPPDIPTLTTTLRPTFTATPTATATPTIAPIPTETNTPTRTPTATPTSTITLTPSQTPTPKPITYPGLTIDELSQRGYGGGQISLENMITVQERYTRTVMRYPSDDLTIYGFIDVPKGEGPFPVAIVLHGHVPAEQWRLVPYSGSYASALADAGYLVLHPNMRGFAPSDDGPDWFRIGLAVDVLNLIGIVEQTAGQPGSPLVQADGNFIGLMGHSMGGGVALRVSVVSPAVDAVAVYGSMSGNERWNYEKILRWSGGEIGERELNTPDDILNQISPLFFLDRTEAAFTIHHGELDQETLPWALDLCEQLTGLARTVECFTYPDQPHTFRGEGATLLMTRVVEFFAAQRAQ